MKSPTRPSGPDRPTEGPAGGPCQWPGPGHSPGLSSCDTPVGLGPSVPLRLSLSLSLSLSSHCQCPAVAAAPGGRGAVSWAEARPRFKLCRPEATPGQQLRASARPDWQIGVPSVRFRFRACQSPSRAHVTRPEPLRPRLPVGCSCLKFHTGPGPAQWGPSESFSQQDLAGHGARPELPAGVRIR